MDYIDMPDILSAKRNQQPPIDESLFHVAKYTRHMSDDEIDEYAYAIKMLRLCSYCGEVYMKAGGLTVDIGNGNQRICSKCSTDIFNHKWHMKRINADLEKSFIKILRKYGIFYIDFSHKQDGNGGYVYLVSDNGLVKVGATTRPIHHRIKAQKFHPENIVLVVSTSYPFELERFLHDSFSSKLPAPSKRRGREFFELSDEDIKWVENIVSVNDHCIEVVAPPYMGFA